MNGDPNRDIRVGLSVMPTDDFLRATLPLFEGGEVDVVEWSFDTAWTDRDLPSWMPPVLDDYADAGALLGHGTTYSPLSAVFGDEHRDWLARAKTAMTRRPYQSVTEHFGFMIAGAFEFCAPMPVPYTQAAVRIGVDRLRRLKDAVGVDVGLENLALAFGDADVRDQGPFLEDLLAPVGGFLVLDLHNIHCQARNFDRDPIELLEAYPLARVRQLHVSGGSWSNRGVRQDTHDAEVPEEVFALVPEAARMCSGLRHVILERVGGTLRTASDDARFAEDFRRLRALLRS